MKLEAVTLEGQHVRLEPLAHSHRQSLSEAITDGALWNLQVTRVPHPRDVAHFIDSAHDAHARGDELAFATIDLTTGCVAGSTRFTKVHLKDKRLEIGATFLGQTWQRTRINSEAKLLMLTHAFEALTVNRVEFITDLLNARSRSAIERLGASQEGVLRQHKLMRDGRVRDSVIYSLVASEWPEAKHSLLTKLQR